MAIEVAGLDGQQAEAALSALCGSGLVRPETDTTAGFVHPLFGQSLYHDLAAPVRAGLHARAFTVLCEHGLEAEAVEHAIRGDLIGDQAAIAVVGRAGRAALAAGALGTAAEHLRAAVRLAGDRAAPGLCLALGEALVVGGRPAEAIAVYEQLHPAGLAACDTVAQELMTESGELPEVRWGYGPLAAFAFAGLFTERFADADHALALALATAERIGAAEAAAWHMIIKALLTARQGRLAEALAWVERASPVAELIPYRQGSVGYVKAEVLLLMGRHAECADWCRRIERAEHFGGATPRALFPGWVAVAGTSSRRQISGLIPASTTRS